MEDPTKLETDGVETTDGPTTQELAEKLRVLQAKLDNLKSLTENRITERFGSVEEARKQAGRFDASIMPNQRNEQEVNNYRNLQLAQSHLIVLDKLSNLQENFINRGLIRKEVGVSGIFEDLEKELDYEENFLTQPNTYPN